MTIAAEDKDVKPAASPGADVPRKDRRRRWLLVPVILVPLFIAYWVVCEYLERKLETAVAQKLDAELQIDGLLYFPPYGIRLGEVRLVRKNNVVLRSGRLNLKLAESPFGDDPIVIENFDVADPVVRIIRTKEGFQGGPGFVKDEVKHEPEPKKKFSDFLRLRKFKVTNGQVVYDDDTNPYARDVTWRNINVNIDTARRGPSLYTYNLAFGGAPIGEAAARGSFDVDSLVLGLDEARLAVHVDPARRESPLPSELQKLLKDYAVGGKLSIGGKGTVAFKELNQSTYAGVVELEGGRMRVPQWNTYFNDASLKLRLATAPAQAAATAATEPTTEPMTEPATQPAMPALNVTVESIRVASGGATLAVIGGKLGIDPATRTWSLRELAGSLGVAQDAPARAGAVRDAIDKLKLAGAIDFTAAADGPLKPDANRRLADAFRHEVLLYPRGVAVQPTTWPEPLREIGGGLIRIERGEAVAENLSGLYGQDRWLLNAARVPLKGIKERILIQEMDAALDFYPPSPEYPKALRATVRALGPSGEFPVSGSFDINFNAPPGEKARYDLIVSSDDGAFAVTRKRIPITNIRGDALVRRDAVGTVEIRSFDGESLGGTVSAKASFITTNPKSYAGSASLREINLEQLTAFVDMPEKDQHKLTGRGFANVEASGGMEKQTALDTLRGRGRVELFDGDFFQLPVLGAVAKTVGGGRRQRDERDLGTVGEASIVFAVEDRTVRISESAFSAPLLGVQGGGDVGFDGRLDLDLVAAPLADWRDKLKQTNIPLVSDVTGEIAGAIQRTLNAATRGLLYEFRVGGNLKDPQVKTVPAPALNEARAAIFGGMIGKQQGKRPADAPTDERQN